MASFANNSNNKNNNTATSFSRRKRCRREYTVAAIPAKRTAIWSSDDDDDDEDDGNIYSSSSEDNGEEVDFMAPPASQKQISVSIDPKRIRLQHDRLNDDDDDDDSIRIGACSSSEEEDDAIFQVITKSSPTFQKKCNNNNNNNSRKSAPPRVSLGNSSERKKTCTTGAPARTKQKSRRTRNNREWSNDKDEVHVLQDDSDDDEASSSSSVATAELVRRLHHNSSAPQEQQQQQQDDDYGDLEEQTPINKYSQRPNATAMEALKGSAKPEKQIQAIKQRKHRATIASSKNGEEKDEEKDDFLADPEDDESSSDGEQSVDTVELTRRLKLKLGHPSGGSARSPSIAAAAAQQQSPTPRADELLATNHEINQQSFPSNSTIVAGNGQWSSGDRSYHHRHPHDSIGNADGDDGDDKREKEFLLASHEVESLHSDGEDSADTMELARRLKRNLCPNGQASVSPPPLANGHEPTTESPSVPCPEHPYDDEATLPSEARRRVRGGFTKTAQASAVDFREEDVTDDNLDGWNNDDDDDDDQSADTAELARRLREKLCPSKTSTVLAPTVPAEICAATTFPAGENGESSAGGQPKGDSIQFQLPSQSESSSDEDSEEEVGDDDDDENENEMEQPERGRPPHPSHDKFQNEQRMMISMTRIRRTTRNTTVLEKEDSPVEPSGNTQLKPPPTQQQWAAQEATMASSITIDRETSSSLVQQRLRPPPPEHWNAQTSSSGLPSTTPRQANNPYLPNAPALPNNSPRKMPAKPRTSDNNKNGQRPEHDTTSHKHRNKQNQTEAFLSAQRNFDGGQQYNGAGDYAENQQQPSCPESSSSPPDLYQAAFGASPHGDHAFEQHRQHVMPQHQPVAKHATANRTLGGVTYEDAFGASMSPPYGVDGSAFDKNHNGNTSWRSLGRQGVHITNNNLAAGHHHQPISSAEIHRGEERTEEELYNDAFCEETYEYVAASSRTARREYVVLDDSDSDDDSDRQNYPARLVQAPLVHSGLRTAQRSPRFNIVSRTFPKPQRAASSRARGRPTATTSDIEDFSDEDDCDQAYRPNQKVARRVTEDHGTKLRQQRPRRSATIGNTTATALAVEDDSIDATAPGIVQGGAHATGASGLARPWRRTQKPRLRDAVASNPLNAASVAPKRKLQQQSLPFPTQGSLGRFGTSTIGEQRQRIQNQRNDIHGGSGVGAGGFAYVDNRKHGDDDSDKDEDSDEERQPAATAQRQTTNRRKPATKKTASSRRRKRTRSAGAKKATTTSKKRTTGGKTGGGSGRGRGRGGGRRGGSGGRGSWGGGGRGRSAGGSGGGGGVWGDGNEGNWQVSEAFTREDPAMQHVGGAEIVF